MFCHEVSYMELWALFVMYTDGGVNVRVNDCNPADSRVGMMYGNVLHMQSKRRLISNVISFVKECIISEETTATTFLKHKLKTVGLKVTEDVGSA